MTNTASQTGTCLGIPPHFDNAAGRQIEAISCDQQLEQETIEGAGVSYAFPQRCPGCDAAVTAIGRAKVRYFAEAGERVMERERRTNLLGAGLREDVIDGRISIDRLADMYGATRVAGGVELDRYREIVALVKDFVSVPPLLRSTVPACIMLLHGNAKLDDVRMDGKGTGKTWLLEAAVAHAAMTLNRSAVFTSPFQMWADLKNHDRVEADVLHGFYSVDVLGIDDLARKITPTEWEISILLQVIDERYRQHRATLLSSNYTVKGLFELWSDLNDPRKTRNVELLCDRLADRKASISIQMSGTSLRREK